MKYTRLLFIILLLTGCGFSSSGDESKQDIIPVLIQEDEPEENEPEENIIEMSLDFETDHNDVLDINGYFSLHQHGPTLLLIHFIEKNAVLRIRLNSEDSIIEFSASLNLFDESETEKTIGKWINNRHSDGIYGDAPEPEQSYIIPNDSLSIISSYLRYTDDGWRGDEYDVYAITLNMQDFIVEGEVNLNQFSIETLVYERTKDTGTSCDDPIPVMGKDYDIGYSIFLKDEITLPIESTTIIENYNLKVTDYYFGMNGLSVINVTLATIQKLQCDETVSTIYQRSTSLVPTSNFSIDHWCRILNNNVICSGRNIEGQTDVPDDLVNPRGITRGYYHTCVLTDDGPRCWGAKSRSTDYGQTDVPDDLVDVISIKAGGHHTCALTNDGLYCWGNNDYGQTDIPDGLAIIESLWASDFDVCINFFTETVQCWGKKGTDKMIDENDYGYYLF